MPEFWIRFIAWHVATDHAWDVALHHEAFQLNMQAFMHEMFVRLFPEGFG